MNISFDTKSFLKSGRDIVINSKGQLQNNATSLRKDEGKVYDLVLVEEARLRLNGINDLVTRGLTRTLGGLGAISAHYERVNSMIEASIDMDGRTESMGDRVTFDEVGVPVPIFHQKWSIGERQLLASRQRGEGLDTTQMRIATQNVFEAMEKSLFRGIPGLVVNGNSIYGYTTHPDRSAYTLGHDWSTDSGASLVEDLKAMLNLMKVDRMRGPYVLYVGPDIQIHLESDYSATKGEGTIRDRLLKFQNISDVKGADLLSNGQVVLVQMDPQTVQLGVAQDITNLQWESRPLETDYMVFSAMTPIIKSDRSGRCGIVHGS